MRRALALMLLVCLLPALPALGEGDDPGRERFEGFSFVPVRGRRLDRLPGDSAFIYYPLYGYGGNTQTLITGSWSRDPEEIPDLLNAGEEESAAWATQLLGAMRIRAGFSSVSFSETVYEGRETLEMDGREALALRLRAEGYAGRIPVSLYSIAVFAEADGIRYLFVVSGGTANNSGIHLRNFLKTFRWERLPLLQDESGSI